MGRTQATTKADTLQPQTVQKSDDKFPLTPHRASGQFCKKIKGIVRYFGKIDNPDAAEKLYNLERADWEKGINPRARRETAPAPVSGSTSGSEEFPTVAWICNKYLAAHKLRVSAGEIAERTWQDMVITCQAITKGLTRDRLVADLTSADFEVLRLQLTKRFGPVRLGYEIQRIKSVFKYAKANALIKQEVSFGSLFVKPQKRLLRLAREKRGPRMFTPEQCRAMIEKCGPPLKAFILLGLNGGFTARDCGMLPRNAVDLKSGFISYARPKTGVRRRVPLWKETTEALKASMADCGEFAFVTPRGTLYSKGVAGNDPIGLAFRRLLNDEGLHRAGLGFASLRHVFQTVADGSRDWPAIRCLMGHADSSISDSYREGIEDSRLRLVVDHVHSWLYATKKRKVK